MVEPVGPRTTARWDEYNMNRITPDEYKALAYQQHAIRRNRDSIVSIAPQKEDPAISSVKKSTARVIAPDVPTIGTPRLQTPEERQNLAQEQQKIEKTKSKGVAGFFKGIKNTFSRWFGLNKSAPSDSGASPLTGSPKEVHLNERDAEKWAKALDQLSLAINMLIVKNAESGREAQADGRSSEAELFFHKEHQLKQIKSEARLLKEFIEANREETRIRNTIAGIDIDALFKNHEDGKILQDKKLETSRKLHKRMKSAKYINWVQNVAGITTGICVLASIALLISTGGATAPLALSILKGTGSFATAGAGGMGVHNDIKTGKLKQDKEAFEHASKVLNETYDIDSKHATRMFKQNLDIDQGLTQVGKQKAEVTRSAANNLV